MKHVAMGAIAAFIAFSITISLHFYGAHDIKGFFVAVADYPGLLAKGENAPLNDVRFTAVNWFFYLLLVEAVVALKKCFSKKSERFGA